MKENRELYKHYNIVFENTGKKDIRKFHPCIIIMANDKPYHFVSATYHKKVFEQYQKYYDSNYLILKREDQNIPANALIDLQWIRNDEFEGTYFYSLPDFQYKRFLKKLSDYQKNHPHRLYKDLKPYIMEIIKDN